MATIEYGGQKCEVGFSASPTSGGWKFTRCPNCGRGYNISMWERAPWVQCPNCQHVKVRPVNH